jgi:hypothetical protein
MSKYINLQQEDHEYMFVKVLGSIPYFEDSERNGVEVPKDGMTYFEVISNHFLKGMILRMKNSDFTRRFTGERAKTDPHMKKQFASNIFSSREWLFYDKLKWWNSNIKAVIDSGSRDDLEYVNLYNNYSNEYCASFNTGILEFIEEKNFFDDLLSEVYVNRNGKVTTKKERVGKPKGRKYCSACGNKVKYYVSLPNGKILCRMCEEQIESYKYLEFSKQWEE